ncbi:type III restriction protein res subunit [Caldithrix abyssi DSM 13497]|uniref:Type III restriction enzyme n=1 Tax=Caldithrix abyssi DSM 13497 TaxID=880073 RepID=H1XSW4_CALAY|nr:type III restriction-modification system endonuclease [Caldithrix abyssi]APF20293.1 type III restriction enzyme [Caldithrix abyssi DSM 13497]EHO40341.1 type III restriction protein res subunit [Caldithrix abyssi DSM 13497]
MKGFNFEKNLPHQTRAVESIISVFEGLTIEKPQGINRQYINPVINNRGEDKKKYISNILHVQKENGITEPPKSDSNIIDIMMETGTGKTYTYTKAIFELNKNYGIFKFIIVVPTLSIKAGTINFLKSPSAREHFKEQYGKTINLYVVESQKNNKNKKSYMPQAVSNFVNSIDFDMNSIQVLLINAGMINSDTMKKSFDRTLFDKYTVPFNALAEVKPFVIIDEPHKFAKGNKTWENIQLLKSQYIIRFGATFKEYENLIYTLTAVDAFNNNLVKGVIGYVEEFEIGKNVIVRLVNTDGKEATFELIENKKRKQYKIVKKQSLSIVHPEMTDLYIENLNKSEVVLSNGLSLKRGDKLNPYSYSETLQEKMIKNAVENHFKLEKELLTKDVRIKPLTLFFIDNIEEYRKQDGYVRTTVEQYIKSYAEELLKTETSEFYKEYLKKTIENLSLTHGGYFSKDNTEKDEAIEKEINEILHDKEAILDLNNPRRFIFSKWTLREGWDNPNVFQICKLRSSGSEISKLQEVGRGLRLPVNEYMNRVKGEQFYLNYYVDFTENDFVDRLVNEINEKSNAIPITDDAKELTKEMIKKILEVYNDQFGNEDELLEFLDEKNVITRSNKFKENGFAFIKANFPLIFDGVVSNKIKKATEKKKKVTLRIEKYPELKALWEKLNEKVILEYKFENEDTFKEMFINFLKDNEDFFNEENIKERKIKLTIKDNQAAADEEISVLKDEVIPVVTMKYSEFLKELSKLLNANIKTLHRSFLYVQNEIDINRYLNYSTLRAIKHEFDKYLLFNAIDKFGIEYQKVTNVIHPTKFTDIYGDPIKEVDASDIGILYSKDKVAKNYFLEDLFYDSELEKDNIKTNIKEVVVFTKIPKNSIKIPVAGGKSYSPDFAYVLNYENGDKKLYFLVETKNKEEESLIKEELQKIRHAEKLFGDKVKIKFKTQFSNKKIEELIKDIYE